jgi:hypothetical protein
MLGRLACIAMIVGLGAAAGCYTAPEPDCGFVCGPSGECPADYTCNSSEKVCHRNGAPATLTCTPASVPFDVQSVVANGTHQVTVTFDAAPDATSATTAANYTISGLTIMGTPTLSGASVVLMTTAQMATTYTLQVANVTRASDGAVLSTTIGMFPGVPAFDVTSAMSVDAHTLGVTFSAPPSSSQAVEVANYAVPGLTLTGTPTLAGNVVTLTTSTQAAQSYTVTVTGVQRASDFEPLDVNMAAFAGRNAFLVMSAAATTHTTMTVTFSAPPNAAQATARANYNVPGLTLSGTPTLSGNTVTLTTAGQTATTYTVTVANVTRAADSEPLSGTTSAMFTGRTSFDVTSAASTSNTTVTVTFSAAPDPTAAAVLANYNIAGLTLSGTPMLSGNTVTLTTSSQTGSMYTVAVANVTRAADGEPLATTSAMFTGRTEFDVASAMATTNIAISVTFSAPPEPTSATTLMNYSVAGLTLSGTPSLAGSTVTITTSAQAAQMYTVVVANVTRASDGEALTTTMAPLTGVTCNDAMLDGDETDTDCGGSVCGPCANGQMCLLNRDCVSNNCNGLVCAP